MKTVVRTAIVLATLIALTGCYVALDNGSGEVGIVLPDPRSASEAATADVARIYVLNGPNLVPVGDGTDYAEFELAPSEGESLTEATVGPVPSGGGYQVVLVFGDNETITSNNDFSVGGSGFVPTEYAVSGTFTVNAGQATVTDVTLTDSLFVPVDGGDTLGLDVLGIVFSTGDLYVASESTVLTDQGGTPGSFGTVDFDTQIPLNAGENVTSITKGAVFAGEALFINSSQGVRSVRNTSEAPADFDQNMPSGIDGPILDSAGIVVGGTAYGYMQYAGGLTGYRNTGAGAPGTGDWMEPADLSDITVGQPVLDLAVAETPGSVMTGYFASKLGAFSLPEAVLTDAIDTTEEVLDAANFFSAEIEGSFATITKIGIAADSTAAGGSDPVILGTRRGALATTVGALNDGAVISGTPIAGTANQEVRDIVVAEVGGSVYIVLLTDHFLVYSLDNGATWEDPLPVYASSAGQANSILLDTTSSVLLIAGETGLAGIDLDG